LQYAATVGLARNSEYPSIELAPNRIADTAQDKPEGTCDARSQGMAAHTHQLPQLHDHAGARWLAPMTLAMIVAIAMIVAMMIYPFVS